MKFLLVVGIFSNLIVCGESVTRQDMFEKRYNNFYFELSDSRSPNGSYSLCVKPQAGMLEVSVMDKNRKTFFLTDDINPSEPISHRWVDCENMLVIRYGRASTCQIKIFKKDLLNNTFRAIDSNLLDSLTYSDCLSLDRDILLDFEKYYEIIFEPSSKTFSFCAGWVRPELNGIDHGYKYSSDKVMEYLTYLVVIDSKDRRVSLRAATVPKVEFNNSEREATRSNDKLSLIESSCDEYQIVK